MLKSLRSKNDIATLHGYDPTEGFLTHSTAKGYDKVFQKREFPHKYDLIFVHMVLGGLTRTEVTENINYIKSILNKDGVFFLVEAVNDDSPRIYSKWKIYKSSDYMKETNGLTWKEVGIFLEQGQSLKIMVGRRV